ncbi:MAG: hypothetical protein AMXMBFR33_41280 [Candidatus Xenobia bacterium]
MSRRPNTGPFSRVPNPLAEALARTDLSSREHRVVWVFVRQILGWKERRETNRLAIGRGELEALTGIHRADLRTTVGQLLERGILRRAESPGNAKNAPPTEYIFVTNPKHWKGLVKPERAQGGGGHPTSTPLEATPPPGGHPTSTPGGHPTSTPLPKNGATTRRARGPLETLKKGVLEPDTPNAGSTPGGVLPQGRAGSTDWPTLRRPTTDEEEIV